MNEETVDRDKLVKVPLFPKYLCDLENGDIYTTHHNGFRKMNLASDKDGYKKLCLYEGSTKKYAQAHRVLVACRDGTWDNLIGMQVDHKVMIKDLNKEENLRIVTRQEQFTDEMRLRISIGKKGTKLSDEAVRDIRQGYDGLTFGFKRAYIEKMVEKYDRRFVIINDVCIRRTYKKVV